MFRGIQVTSNGSVTLAHAPTHADTMAAAPKLAVKQRALTKGERNATAAALQPHQQRQLRLLGNPA
jgi:hypothetical protein